MTRRRASAELAALFRVTRIRRPDFWFSAEPGIPSWNPSCHPVAMPLEVVTGRARRFVFTRYRHGTACRHPVEYCWWLRMSAPATPSC